MIQKLRLTGGIDNPIVSQKDMQAPTLAESDVNLTMELNFR